MGRMIGREAELTELRAFLDDPTIHGCVVYGVRQVGKTTLLRHLVDETRSIYIQAIRGSEQTIVSRAMAYVRRVFDIEAEPHTLSELLDVLESVCRESPTLIVIDEYQYLSSSLVHADSMVQGFVDMVLPETGSKMIVCGSQISSILGIVRDTSNPLYNRFRWSLEVRGLRFGDTCLFHPGMGDTDLLRMYMVFGGMPSDHLAFRGETFRDVIEGRMLGRGLPFGNLARARIAEAGDPEVCESIVRAIATGERSLKGISQATGVSMTTCSRHIDRLESIGVVGRYRPMSGAPERPRYLIADGLVGLWYAALSDIDENDLPDDPADRYDLLSGSIDTFLGHRFEMFCMEYLRSNYACTDVGSWWGTEIDEDGVRIGVDIDVVAKVRIGGRKLSLYGECKFRNRMMKLSDLQTLERRARALDTDPNLILFSAGGFERQLTAVAKSRGVLLVGIEELMGRAPAPPLLSAGNRM